MSDDLPVSASEIHWTPDPLPRLELLPLESLFALDANELVEYAFHLQQELHAVRTLMHEGTAALMRVTDQRDRLQQTVVRLHEVLRQQRSSS